MKLLQLIAFSLCLHIPALNAMQPSETCEQTACLSVSSLIVCAGLMIAIPFTYKMCCGNQAERDNDNVQRLAFLGMQLTEYGIRTMNKCKNE